MSKRPEVIIIDDDRCTLEMNKLTVNSVLPGAEIRTFLSARTALEYLRNLDPDGPDSDSGPGADSGKSIIVSDLHMPVVDGFQFLEEFALLPSAVCSRYAVFVLSADADTADVLRLANKTCLSGFFLKPLTVKKFAALLRKAGG